MADWAASPGAGDNREHARARGSSPGSDDTTHRYSKHDIARLQRHAAKPDPIYYRSIPEPSPARDQAQDGDNRDARESDEHEWVELGGHRRRISLAAFTLIGSHGGHPRALGSADRRLVSGEIDTSLAAAARQPRWRRAGAALALAGTIGALTIWFMQDREAAHGREAARNHQESAPQPVRDRPAAAATIAGTQPDPEARAPTVEHQAPVEPQASADPSPAAPAPRPDEAETEPPTERRPRRDESESQECVELREQAMAAQAAGEWDQLVQLTERRRCWARASTAKALRMRALFELGHHSECIELGNEDRSQEVKKWLDICQRAQG